MFNRREVYRILQEEGIDLPRYAVLNRDPDKPDGETGSSVFMQKIETLFTSSLMQKPLAFISTCNVM